jgi:hypothetical protein
MSAWGSRELRAPPILRAYAEAGPLWLADADAFRFEPARLPELCAGAPALVECELGPEVVLARQLDGPVTVLHALLPCWSLWRRHPAARRLLVLRGGVRFGLDAFAPRLLRLLGADVLLRTAGAGAPGTAQAMDACVLHATRLGPLRTGWPLEAAPAAPAADAADAAADTAAAAVEPVDAALADEEAAAAAARLGRRPAPNPRRLRDALASAGPVAYAFSADDVRALANLLAPTPAADGAGGAAARAAAPSDVAARLRHVALRSGRAAPIASADELAPLGAGNLSLAFGFLEPEGGLGKQRQRYMRTLMRARFGEGVVVRATQVVLAGLAEQARFVRAHGVLIVSHGHGGEALLFVRPCTAVLELYPDFHYRPGLLLPLVRGLGALAFTGVTNPRAAVHTWQRLASVGAPAAELLLNPPAIAASALAPFLESLVGAREACLRERGAGGA